VRRRINSATGASIEAAAHGNFHHERACAVARSGGRKVEGAGTIVAAMYVGVRDRGVGGG
jgi:hypothetical protein